MIEVVAEIGLNHNGNLCIAKKLIDVASSAGILFVKFQKREINLVYSKEELDKPRESPWGETTRAQKEGLEFSFGNYKEIDTYCQSKKIKWFASIWDIESAFGLYSFFDLPFYKIPSPLITNIELLERVRDLGRPIILSTGMSTLEMVDKAIDVIGKEQVYCIMACTSTYPSKPEESNVKCVTTLKEKYPWAKIGFSNHYPGLMSMIMAYTLGAEMLEFHITLDRSMYGSDQSASISPKGVYELMERIQLIEKMKGDGIKKIFDSELPIMKKLRR
uniref:Putative N-acetylneuraminate synthase n=1 Tax=viral metagenome TaxID=1070528 RepID=A0A6H1ZX80_9ZZZZ